MIRGIFIWTAAYFAAVAMTASAQTPTPAAMPQPDAGVDQAGIDQGKVTYAQKCSHCHGPNMVTARHHRARPATVSG